MKDSTYDDWMMTKDPRTHTDDLVRLSKSSDYMVRRGVAAHLGTPAWVLAGYANDEDQWVQRIAKENPNFPK